MSVGHEVRITLRLSDTLLGWVVEQAGMRGWKTSAMWRYLLMTGQQTVLTGSVCADPRHERHLAELGRFRQMLTQQISAEPFELPEDVTGWEFVILGVPPEPPRVGVTDLTSFEQPEALPVGFERIDDNWALDIKGRKTWTGPTDAAGQPLYEESA